MSVGERLRAAIAAPEATQAVAAVAVGAAVFAVPVRAVVGVAGWLAIVIALAVFSSAALVARGRDSRSPTILPITVLLPLAWAALSLAWSGTRWATLGGLVPLLGVALVGIALATVRDSAQILRTLADVARAALLVSLLLELASGVILDTPFEFLGIEGDLAALGPIQGVAGSSDRLGVLALVAGIVFGVETAMRALPRAASVASLAMAGAVFALARSGLAVIALAAVAAAIGLLAILRRMSDPARRATQWGIAAALGLGAAAAWAARGPLLSSLGASSASLDLVELWQSTWRLFELKPVTGWGWVGAWDDTIAPYRFVVLPDRIEPASASNAALDLLLQLGVVGLAAGLALAGLALARCWRHAATSKPVVAVWPALVLVAVGAASAADSLVLVDWGLLLLAVCAGIGSRREGWGRAPTR